MRNRWAIASIFCLCSQVLADSSFDDGAKFSNAVGYAKTYTFEIADGFPAAEAKITSFDNGQVEAMTTFGVNGPAAIELYPGSPSTNQTLTGIDADGNPFRFPLTVTFKLPRLAIGFDDLGLSSSIIGATVNVTHPNGDTESFHFQDNDKNPDTSVFFGALSTKGIKSVEVYAENLLCDAIFCFTPNPIDNLRASIPGDFDASGRIDADDYFQIDRGFIHSGDPSSPYKGYYNGDVNFDGVIDADDYFEVDIAYLNQPINGAALNATAIPEPASVIILCLGGAFLALLRR